MVKFTYADQLEMVSRRSGNRQKAKIDSLHKELESPADTYKTTNLQIKKSTRTILEYIIWNYRLRYPGIKITYDDLLKRYLQMVLDDDYDATKPFLLGLQNVYTYYCIYNQNEHRNIIRRAIELSKDTDELNGYTNIKLKNVTIFNIKSLKYQLPLNNVSKHRFLTDSEIIAYLVLLVDNLKYIEWRKENKEKN